MELPWSFRCFLILFPLIDAARPIAVPEKRCPEGSRLRKSGQGCRCKDHPRAYAIAMEAKYSLMVANDRCTAPGLQTVGFADAEADLCQCVPSNQFALNEHIRVHVAALEFCEATVRHLAKIKASYATTKRLDARRQISRWVNYKVHYTNGKTELCQNVLANVSKHVDHLNPWKSDKAAWKAPEDYGRMEPVKEEASEKDTNAWHYALKHVCHDECEELVDETLKEAEEIVMEDLSLAISPTRSCAKRVVQKVEAETFTCCAQACGWNNGTCLSWPFLRKSQQIQWEAECCSEWNVLKGSSRQKMCNSVLSQTDAIKVSKNDVVEPPDVDTDGVVVGQESILVWTWKGLKSDLAKEYMTMDPKPKVGKPVDGLILMHQNNLRKTGLNEGWFKEVPLESQKSFLKKLKEKVGKVKGWVKGLFKGGEGDPSLLETAESSCDPPAGMHKCTATFKEWYFDKCTKEKGWRYSPKSDTEPMQCSFTDHDAKNPSDCMANFEKDKEVARYFEFSTSLGGIICRKVTTCENQKKWKKRNFILEPFGHKTAKDETLELKDIGFWHYVG